jgi:hypothetical protein
MTESLVGSGASLHKAINPSVVVEPVEASLYLPALTGVAGLAAFRGGNFGSIVLPSGNTGVYPSGNELMTEWVAVISFVRTEAHGCSDGDTINGAERQRLIMSVCSPTDNGKEAPLPINYNTPF